MTLAQKVREFPLSKNWPAPGEQTLRDILERRAQEDPDHKFCVWDGGFLTIGGLNAMTNKFANALLAIGLKRGDVVAVMMEQHIEHIALIFAFAKIGLTRISINTSAKGDYLSLLFFDAKPRAIIAEAKFEGLLEEAFETHAVEFPIWNHDEATGAKDDLKTLIALGADTPPVVPARTDNVLIIAYSSGTTGAPKKFTKTDAALQVGATGCLIASDMEPGDVLLLWEPLYHGAGSQLVMAATMEKVTLALAGHFSASNFFDFARKWDVTKVHYIGGILPILLKQPPSPNDSKHKVKIAWGGGCPPEAWEKFERRFNLRINEGYGLTECANFVAINVDGPRGSVGRALPFVDIRTVDDEGKDVGVGQLGEIIVRAKKAEYFSVSHNKTTKTLGDRWVQTGDIGRLDENGNLYFEGRKTDSLRRRGVNISAWEVERVIVKHPKVEECALIAVPSGLGDDDLKIFIRLTPGEKLDELELVKWCEDQMPYFQIPRYIKYVDEFPKTPTQRVRKAELSKSTTDCWDLETMDYKLRK